ncbi:MAG: LiaF domain-containing protein [Spirochaetia bacterium]
MYGEENQENMEMLRERTIDKLTVLYSNNTIDVDDFERRLGLVNHADTSADILKAVSDLPVTVNTAPTEPQNRSLSYRINRGQVSPSATIVNIFSGSSRKGMWKPAKTINIVNVFGGCDLDFREAVIPAEGCTVRVNCAFGGADIIVPPGVNVSVNGFAIFGGFDSKGVEGDYPNAPHINVTGFAVFGGVDVKVKEPK